MPVFFGLGYDRAMKITRKFLILFLAVLFFPALGIHQGVVQYTRHVMQSNIISQNESITELIVKRLSTEIGGVVLQLQLVAGVPDETRPQLDVMYERAKLAISNSTIIHSIYYLDADKNMVFEAPFHPEGRGVKYDYPKFDHVRWSYTYVVTGLVTNPQGEGAITVAIPVFYEDRRLQGLLVAELSRNYLSNILRSTSVTRGGFSFLVDGEGRVIASTDEADWGSDFSQEPIVRRLQRGDSGSIRESYRGQPSLMTYQTMRENWGLAVGVPEDVAFAPVKTLSQALTYSYLGFFGLIVVLILFTSRTLLLPILRLTHFVRQFRGDSVPKPLPPSMMKQRDEIGDLSRTVTDMAARIGRQHRFLQDIIEGIPYALATLNGGGVITHVNQKWANLFDLKAEDVKGKRIGELPGLPFSSLDKPEQELAWTDKNGQTRILKVVNAPFQDGVLTIVQDISQLKMWEAQAAQSEKLAIIGQISTGIAHELKNPLAVLASSSELLLEEIETNRDSEWVATLAKDIDEEIRRMTQVVNEFLSFARARREEIADVELDQLMERVLNLTRIKRDELGIRVVREYHTPLPVIRGKPNKLIQVFLNLLLNSMESMKDGGTITIRIAADEEEARVEIRDEGCGIPEEHMQWLFNPFFTTKDRGTGLGLTIARDIMQEHGGSLEIESRVRQGTLVRCRFPLRRQQAAG